MPTPARISPALCTKVPTQSVCSPIPTNLRHHQSPRRPFVARVPRHATRLPLALGPRAAAAAGGTTARARGHGHDEPRRRLVRVRGSRAPCGGGATEPVETRKDGLAPAVDQADQEAGLLAPEELEVLEEAAITGDDEGRRPTDYDRRAHIFEESSRVFRELKQRSDGGGSESGRGGVTTTGATATAAETRACNEQQQ